MFSLLHWQADLIAGISLPGRDVAVCQLADTTVARWHRQCASRLARLELGLAA
jgi:hypothetical protein